MKLSSADAAFLNMVLSVPAPNGGNWNAISQKLLSVSSRLHDKVLVYIDRWYSFARLWIFGAGGFWIFLFVGYCFNHSYRSQTDFAVCGQRPDGSVLWTPASLSGKRLDLNPLPCTYLCWLFHLLHWQPLIFMRLLPLGQGSHSRTSSLTAPLSYRQDSSLPYRGGR